MYVKYAKYRSLHIISFTFFLIRIVSAVLTMQRSTMPSRQSSQRHTSSPSMIEPSDPMLLIESNESVRKRFLASGLHCDAASIFFANRTSINDFERVDDEYKAILFTFIINCVLLINRHVCCGSGCLTITLLRILHFIFRIVETS